MVCVLLYGVGVVAGYDPIIMIRNEIHFSSYPQETVREKRRKERVCVNEREF